MVERKTVSQCISSDYCKGWNDAVNSVVRCEDCRYCELHVDYLTGKTFNFGYCYHWDYEQGESPNSVDADDFCSYGEKRR